jgi:hypothetical protein
MPTKSDAMSPQEEDAIIGKLVRERKAAKHTLALLQTEVGHIREKLRKMVLLLENNAHLVWIDGASTNEHYLDARLNDYVSGKLEEFQLSDLDGKRIADLTSRIRDTMDELERLNKEAAKHGV